MTAVFADTHYYIALVNPADRGHGKAVAFAKSGLRPIVTTGFIVTELGDAFRSGSPIHFRELRYANTSRIS